MSRTLAITTCALVCHLSQLSVAAAEPTSDELAERAKALTEKLDGQGFQIVVEAPFVVVAQMPAAQTRRIAKGFLHDKIALLEKDFFPKRPDKLLEIWLFPNEKSFRKGAKKYFDDTPDTPYGYYSPDANALIMNAGGLGTLSHELVHPYMEANFPGVPSWFNEGLASLYEYPGELKGHIIGHVNWRLPNLQREIRAKTLPDLATLMSTTRDGFYEASFDSYAYARYLLYYLQEKGLLRAYYAKFKADTKDPTGMAALADVLGEDLETFEPKWRAFVLKLRQ